MSDHLIKEYYKNLKEHRNKHFILPKKYKILNHAKFSSIGRIPKNKIFLKLKVNTQDYTDKNHFNKNHKIKSNVTSSNNLQLIIQNYKNKSNKPTLSSKNIMNRNSEKLVSSIYNFSSSNNNNNNKPKVILPHLHNFNYNNYYNKKPIMENEAIAIMFRKKLKEISLGELFSNDNSENEADTHKEKEKKINKNIRSHSNSEWNLFKDNNKESKKNDDLLNYEDLLFSHRKYSIINNDFLKVNKSVEEKYKNGAERLKEIHRQKLMDCDKLIKKMKKETENKKQILSKYLKIMKQNFENSVEFNTKL